MYKIIGADQKEYGPITEEQMRQWIVEGRVNAQTLVWSESSPNWKTLSTYPEFAASFPPTSPSAPPMGGGMAPGQKIPNYLVPAILCTLCCCLPGGIVAIVYAAQVNSKVGVGDYAGAQASSANAKKWCWISFGVGLVVNLIVFGIQFAAGFARSH